MAKKKTVSIRSVDKKALEAAYAAWGTTREDHLEKMKQFIERQKAEAGMPLAETPMESIRIRAAALRPAALNSVVYKKLKSISLKDLIGVGLLSAQSKGLGISMMKGKGGKGRKLRGEEGPKF